VDHFILLPVASSFYKNETIVEQQFTLSNVHCLHGGPLLFLRHSVAYIANCVMQPDHPLGNEPLLTLVSSSFVRLERCYHQFCSTCPSTSVNDMTSPLTAITIARTLFESWTSHSDCFKVSQLLTRTDVAPEITFGT